MTELRQFYRAPSSRKVELLHEGRCHEGYLENISFNGALIHLGAPISSLAVGTGCLLRIHLDPLPAPRSPLQIWTEVVHGQGGLLGLKFVDHDAEGSDCIALLMELIREEPHQSADQMDRIRGYLSDFCGTP